MFHLALFLLTSVSIWHAILAVRFDNTTATTDSDSIDSATAHNPLTTPTPTEKPDAKRCYALYSTPEIQRTGSSCRLLKTPALSDYTPYTVTSLWGTMTTSGAGSPYTDCDGIPRFRLSSNASLKSSAYEVTVTARGWKLPKSWWECDSDPELPEPGCKVPQEYCSVLWESYSKKVSAFSETEPFQTAPGQPWSPCLDDKLCHLDDLEDYVLLYWPSGTASASRNICTEGGTSLGTTEPPATAPVTTITRIKFPGVNSYRKSVFIQGRKAPFIDPAFDDPRVQPTVITGSWVLTSPDVLLANKPMTMTSKVIKNGTTEWGGATSVVRPAGVMTLKPEDLYTQTWKGLFPTQSALREAQKMANGSWRMQPEQYYGAGVIPRETVPLNLDHLRNPVPASIYFGALHQCWGETDQCATIVDDTYRFRLLIANRAWRTILPDHMLCEKPAFLVSAMALSATAAGEPSATSPKPTTTATTTTRSRPGEGKGRRPGPKTARARPRPRPRSWWAAGPMRTSRRGDVTAPTPTAQPEESGTI